MKCYLKVGLCSYDWFKGHFLVCKEDQKCLLETELTPDMDINEEVRKLAANAVRYSEQWFIPKLYKCQIEDGSLYIYYTCNVPYNEQFVSDGYSFVALKDFDVCTQADIQRINNEI